MTRHVFILLGCLGATGPPIIKTCQAEIPRGPHLVSKGERHIVLVMFHAGLVDKLDISVSYIFHRIAAPGTEQNERKRELAPKIAYVYQKTDLVAFCTVFCSSSSDT